jgi:hypothetical protein
VIALLAAGVASLIAFALIERRVANPMFRLPLFRIVGRDLLPAADLGAVSQRPARGVRVRDRRLPGRRGGLVLTRSPSVRAARRRTIEWGRALGFAPIRADRRLAFGGLRARGRPALE